MSGASARDWYFSAEVLEDLHGEVWRYAAAKAPDGEADDIAQEAIARYLEHRDSLHFRQEPICWLMRVTKNLCSDAYRIRSKLRPAEEAGPERESDAAPSALDVVVDHEVSEILARAVTQLPEPDRAVVVQHVLFGLSYQEIAAGSDATAGALRVRAHRAIRRLAEEVEDLRNLGLILLLRFRARHARVPSELPAFTATAFSQFVVPLAILAGIVSGATTPARGAEPRPSGWSQGQDPGNPASGAAAVTSSDLDTARAAGQSQPAARGQDHPDTVRRTVDAGPARVEHSETSNPLDHPLNGETDIVVKPCYSDLEVCDERRVHREGSGGGDGSTVRDVVKRIYSGQG